MQTQSQPASDTTPVNIPGGDTVQMYPPGIEGPGSTAYFHGVTIEIGPNTDTTVAMAVFDSLRYDRKAPDTQVPGACTRTRNPGVLKPMRLTHPMILDHGDITLDPPLGSDRATSPPPANAGLDPTEPTTESFRLFLARYSAAYPASPDNNGRLTPDDTNVLAWVLYSQPITTTVSGCGLWGVTVTNARTGAGIGGGGWAPGP